jgi:hypothetical protein
VILYNARLVKSGAAAVVVTAIFGIAAFTAAEWSKTTSTDAAGPDQIRVMPAPATPAGTGSETIKIIPQVAIGSFDSGVTKYSTIVEVVNTGDSDATVAGTFYKEDGDVSPVAMSTNVQGRELFTGNLAAITLPAGRVLVISGGTMPATTPTPGLIEWGKLITTGTVSISTFFEVRDGTTGILYSRIGIAASRPDLSSFLIPRVHTKSGLDVAFALVNTGSSPASITATLKDANGNNVAKRTISMNGRTHQALFAQQFFSLSNESEDRNYQYIIFNSNSASFAAIALAFEGGTQTSFPVDPLQ